MPTSAISILSIVNSEDGVHGAVVIDGTPSGAVSFVASRTPDYSKAASVSSTGSGPYDVAFPTPSLWYVWAIDDNGPIANPGVVFIGLSNDPDENLCGEQVQSILQANLPALNLALQTKLPNATVKKVIYGNATVIDNFPAILVTKPSYTRQYVAFPFVSDYTYRLEIYALIEHQDKTPLLPVAANLCGRMEQILNQEAYESITLASGTALAFCQCTQGEISDEQVDDNKWVAAASLIWTGRALKQDVAF